MHALQNEPRLVVRSEAGAWTEHEAHQIYQEKLMKLRDLYIGQLSHLKHVLLERRRQFLLEWQAAGGSKEEGLYSHG